MQKKCMFMRLGDGKKFTFSEISMGGKRVLKFLPGTVNSYF